MVYSVLTNQYLQTINFTDKLMFHIFCLDGKDVSVFSVVVQTCIYFD